MTTAPSALVAHARDMPSAARHRLARSLRADASAGVVILETCHRVEAYGPPHLLAPIVGTAAGGRLLHGADAARHVIALAVGRDSAVLAEDQVLHQLRTAVAEARTRGPLDPALDRLLDLALRAGRRARSWMPAQRPSLADIALAEGLARGTPDATDARAAVLVVGAGAMGSLAARAAARRGLRVLIASRTPERAARLAAGVGADCVAFDPGAEALGEVAGVVVALSGPWQLSEPSATALAEREAWLVDLSSPPAVAPHLVAQLGPRYVSVDDLAAAPAQAAPGGLAARLDGLVEATVQDFARWLAGEPQREAARALADRADAARAAELAALWERVPALAPADRAEVERMAERLAARLLRDPIERLRGDDDGRRRQAARELFGL